VGGWTRPHLPANPDDLLAEGWKETTHPKAAARGHRDFVNERTGMRIRFDKGDPNDSTKTEGLWQNTATHCTSYQRN
jgi:hypothetical protein